MEGEEIFSQKVIDDVMGNLRESNAADASVLELLEDMWITKVQQISLQLSLFGSCFVKCLQYKTFYGGK
jgi:hypothetical protein